MALLLFDIDGTLLAPRDIGRRAFEKALAELYPGHPPSPRFPYDGLLDPEIARRTLAGMGLGAGDDVVATILEAYLIHLAEERPATPEGYLCPGVPGVLHEASRRGHGLAVLTGNISEGARMKLDFFGLGGYFQAGAFGEDAPDRSGLVPVAIERLRRAGRGEYALGETWIVGDSPRDLGAAREAGVRCALVATGTTPRSALARLTPDLLLDDLSDCAPLWVAVEAPA